VPFGGTVREAKIGSTSMIIGIPRESLPGETRVAATPQTVAQLLKLGYEVAVESGAGAAASFSDAAYTEAGATIGDPWAADIVLKVNAPNDYEIALLRDGATLISLISPALKPELVEKLSARPVTVLAMDALPRTLSRAQKMDALTSMAGVSGYRAVIEAANAFGRFFSGQITAAGKVPPARVFIAGAGVAGLAAIGTAANMGAMVRANDTRAEVADQVVSLGGEFVKVGYEEEGSGGGGYAKVMSEGFQQAQRAMYAQQAREADIIITTALIPGKPAPRLITAEMVRTMKPGSVIVDMAAEQGGNCELTEPGQAVVKHGVTIIGYTDLASRLARQSSTLYSTNLLRLTEELCKTKDGVINVNMEDDAIRGLTVIKDGTVTWPAPPLKLPAPAPKPAAVAAPALPLRPAALTPVAIPAVPAAPPAPSIPAVGPDSDVEVLDSRSGPLKAKPTAREREFQRQQLQQLQQQEQQLRQLQEQQRRSSRLQIQQHQQQEQAEQQTPQQSARIIGQTTGQTERQKQIASPQLIGLPAAARAIATYPAYPYAAYSAAYSSPFAYAAPLNGLAYTPAAALT